ncbi:hypothetical protein V2J09_005501 [Rumex salicifolius]
MSSVWETYVDEMMSGVDGHHLTSAAILGQDGTLWAQSAAFPPLKAEQGIAIMKDIDEQTGILIGSTSYMFIQGNPRDFISGKKVLANEIIFTIISESMDIA